MHEAIPEQPHIGILYARDGPPAAHALREELVNGARDVAEHGIVAVRDEKEGSSRHGR